MKQVDWFMQFGIYGGGAQEKDKKRRSGTVLH